MMAVAALLMLFAVFAIFGAGAWARADEKRRDRETRAALRQAELAQTQADKYAAMRLDGTHLFARRGYKPAIAYLAPEKREEEKPANVAQLRRKRS